MVNEESLEEGPIAAEGIGWGALWWPHDEEDEDVDWRSELVEVLLSWRCCLGCGMGLFFEGVSVGDGEGDGTPGAAAAAFDAGLAAASGMAGEEADEGGAGNYMMAF